MADTFLNNKLKLPKDQALKPAKISNKPVSQKERVKKSFMYWTRALEG